MKLWLFTLFWVCIWMEFHGFFSGCAPLPLPGGTWITTADGDGSHVGHICEAGIQACFSFHIPFTPTFILHKQKFFVQDINLGPSHTFKVM